MSTAEAPHLKRTLGPLMLWGLGVGYVISGDYFGWNLGLPAAGTYGMLAATLLVTIMYATFVPSYAELACAMPAAGGAYVYATRAFGPRVGLLAGVCQLVEFVFAPPAIALAIGAYLQIALREYVGIEASPIALGAIAYVSLTALNAWGVKQAATFELFVTIIAVAELCLFIAVTAPSFRMENVTHNALPHGWLGTFDAFPAAIWFYLAIEGVANAAEEARDPNRDLPRGFVLALITLIALALGVFFCAIGVAGWEAIVYPTPGSEVTSDSPLPLAMAHAVPTTSIFYRLLIGVGLFGLVASFHGILLAAGRATMAMGQAGHAPRRLGAIHPKTGTPIAALLANCVVGILALLTGRTTDIITLACFGAVGLYILSLASVFVLRRKEPDLARPFRVPGFPTVPALSLLIAVVCLLALGWSSPTIAAIFASILALSLLASGFRSPVQRT